MVSAYQCDWLGKGLCGPLGASPLYVDIAWEKDKFSEMARANLWRELAKPKLKVKV
jgi:hypothetical protein